ncbi:hypothetical protein EW146_g6308 [Bondarzewia mesenterica]|uniref:Uncharacterized protein n=1 Tax=Bondarzewia mesenterica TaxID=1095465 RepID=A0A4S4LNZ4_9AGAM|nr:hypothetical protein EW146_g6308 [Bondarzewia mesenterica]
MPIAFHVLRLVSFQQPASAVASRASSPQSPTASSTYHFYELDVAALDQEWLESKERRREWVDYAEAVRRVSWKQELAQGLMLSSLAPRR